MNVRRFTIALFALSLVALQAVTASADPLTGQKLKFAQWPLNGGNPTFPTPGTTVPGVAPFPGHDELSTAWLDTTNPNFNLSGIFMADDFADNYNTPVVHVQWWGSYMNQSQPGTVPAFSISFEADVPVGGNNPLPYSHPGAVLSSQIVTKAAALAPGLFTEAAVPVVAPGGPDGNLFQYNAELAIPFNQLKDTVYWLKIVALDPAHTQSDPGRIQWGWHNRDYGVFNPNASPVPVPGEFNEGVVGGPIMWHFQDDAVTGRVLISANPASGLPPTLVQDGYQPTDYLPGIDYPTGLQGKFSKDLAFALYTIPEPSSVVLMGFGALALVIGAYRKRRAMKG